MDTVWARGALSFHKKSECKDTKNRAKNKLKHTTFLRHFFAIFANPFVQTAFKNCVKNIRMSSQQVNKRGLRVGKSAKYVYFLCIIYVYIFILYIYYNIYII